VIRRAQAIATAVSALLIVHVTLADSGWRRAVVPSRDPCVGGAQSCARRRPLVQALHTLARMHMTGRVRPEERMHAAVACVLAPALAADKCENTCLRQTEVMHAAR